MRVGTRCIFDSADQIVFTENRRPMKIYGKHLFVKVKDSFMDRLKERSWYLMDNETLVDIGRGSYIETRCLVPEDKYNEYHKE